MNQSEYITALREKLTALGLTRSLSEAAEIATLVAITPPSDPPLRPIGRELNTFNFRYKP